MAELGFFNSERVEFIAGEIVAMAAQSDWHLMAIDLMRMQLELALGPNFYIRAQGTLNLAPLGVLDPDIAVIAGSLASRFGVRTPATTALLIVEVSETTLADDRVRKASLYAAAGIADYWIVNLVDAVLEVRRDPRVDATAEFGMSYGSLATLQRSDDVSPLAMPNSRIAVNALFPF